MLLGAALLTTSLAYQYSQTKFGQWSLEVKYMLCNALLAMSGKVKRSEWVRYLVIGSIYAFRYVSQAERQKKEKPMCLGGEEVLTSEAV
jgi:hypothetical protein